MRVCHIQSIFSPEHGGPTHSLGNYCRAQIEMGLDVSLAVLEGYPGTSPAVRLPAPVRQVVLPVTGPAKLGHAAGLVDQLAELPEADVYHVHGTWHLAMRDAVLFAQSRGKPVLLELMGSFSAYELSRKPMRKWLARILYQNRVLSSVNCLHANSKAEADHLRFLGFKTPAAVIPVGVRVPDLGRIETPAQPVLPPDWAGQPWLLYLGRLHTTKGIDLLLQAWAEVGKEEPNKAWRLLVAGHGEADYVAELKQQARACGLDACVHFAGPLDEVQKAWAYANASAYILPSRQENFGNTVAEALAHGRPVASTTGTPWSLLEAEQCGWVTAPTAPGIADMLRRMAATSPDKLNEMGRKGRALVEREFSISLVNRTILETYEWLLGRRSPPAAVRI